MRRFPVLMFAVFLGVIVANLAGCVDSMRQKILGKWSMTIEMNETELSQMSPTENPLAAAFTQMLMKTVQAEMSMDFRSDDTVLITMAFLGNRFDRSATWKIVDRTEDTATIEITMGDGTAPSQWTIKFLDPNSFQTTPPANAKWAGNKMVTFRRVTDR